MSKAVAEWKYREGLLTGVQVGLPGGGSALADLKGESCELGEGGKPQQAEVGRGTGREAGLWSSSLAVCWGDQYLAVSPGPTPLRVGRVRTLGATSLWNLAAGSLGCTAARREVGSVFQIKHVFPSLPQHPALLSSSASDGRQGGGVGGRGVQSSYTASTA